MPGSLAYDHDIHASLRATVLEASRVLVPDCRTTAPLASRSRRRGNPGHGDMATNAALVAAKTARRAPAHLAAAIVELPRRAPVSNAGAAGPGFVNPGLDAAVLRLLLPDDWRARAGLGGTQRAAGVVADYVAGMTDRYAMDEHRRLTDLSVSG